MTRAQTGTRRTSAPRRSSTYASRSPGGEPRPTEAETLSSPGTVTVGGSVSRTALPPEALKTTRATFHVPAPPPASSRPTVCVASCPRARRPNETAVGLGEEERAIGALQRDHASTLESRPGGAAALVDRIDARLHERRLQLLHRPRRVALAQESRRAGDVRRRHARPRELGPAAAGDRREHVDSRRCDVRLQT